MASNKTMDDFLMNAKSIQFLFEGENQDIPAVFVIFEDVNTGVALYTEVVRVNKENPQYLGFKKSHSSLILSFILEKNDRPHAKMLLDYDEKEFDNFISKVSPTDFYILLFGQMGKDGKRITGGFQESPQSFRRYLLE
jgi:hypothetical protein